VNDENKWFRFNSHVKVWDDYQKIFGTNTPMKRCAMPLVGKEWDINFEGVAHYGLVPDFLQDLSNVGLNAPDMSPLFLSAEHFAQMWTKALNAAVWAGPHFVNLNLGSSGAGGGRELEIKIDNAEEKTEIEESETPGDPSSWKPAQVRGRFAHTRRHERRPASSEWRDEVLSTAKAVMARCRR
jgi:hypothetical protein